MNFSTAILILFSFFPVIVKANNIVQILINEGEPVWCISGWDNGAAIWTDKCCSDDDWAKVEHKIYTMSQNQRMRRLRSEESVVVETVHRDRELPFYSAKCANSCAGFVKGKCLAVNCKGYRRGLLATIMARELYRTTDCNNQKSELNNALNNLRNEVSSTCRAVLEAPRTMTCFTDEDC
jgi:hypothetical protein